jgi:acetylornithine deacetylase/succinyl-diaminopimelate desuccinylase-like protein
LSQPCRSITVIAALGLIGTLGSRPVCAAEEWNARGRALLDALIALDTSSHGRQVPAAVELLAREFRAAGFPESDIHVLPLAGTASLVVRYRGDGSGGRPILLLAHLDVVPARREDWQREPFRVVEEGGFLFGRGTADNKGGAVAIATALLRLRAEGFRPTRDLILYFSGDEETAQFTALDVVRNRRELVDAEFALNSDAGGGTLDEQTGRAAHYGLQTAEKVYADFELVVTNPGGHSSMPRRDNAIYQLAGALGRVQALRFPVMWNEATLAQLRLAGETATDEVGEMLRRFAADPRDAAAAERLFDEPAYVGKTRTTCVATLLSAGHAPNALPQNATATVNCRIFPGMPIETVRRALTDAVGTGVDVRLVGEPMWSDPSPLREDVVAAVTRSVRAMHPGVRVIPAQSSGATDGLVFRSAGIPTYGVSGIFMKASDDYSHGLDERIPVRAFHDDLAHWHRLLTDLAGPHAGR